MLENYFLLQPLKGHGDDFNQRLFFSFYYLHVLWMHFWWQNKIFDLIAELLKKIRRAICNNSELCKQGSYFVFVYIGQIS